LPTPMRNAEIQSDIKQPTLSNAVAKLH